MDSEARTEQKTHWEEGDGEKKCLKRSQKKNYDYPKSIPSLTVVQQQRLFEELKLASEMDSNYLNQLFSKHWPRPAVVASPESG